MIINHLLTSCVSYSAPSGFHDHPDHDGSIDPAGFRNINRLGPPVIGAAAGTAGARCTTAPGGNRGSGASLSMSTGYESGKN